VAKLSARGHRVVVKAGRTESFDGRPYRRHKCLRSDGRILGRSDDGAYTIKGRVRPDVTAGRLADRWAAEGYTIEILAADRMWTREDGAGVGGMLVRG